MARRSARSLTSRALEVVRHGDLDVELLGLSEDRVEVVGILDKVDLVGGTGRPATVGGLDGDGTSSTVNAVQQQGTGVGLGCLLVRGGGKNLARGVKSVECAPDLPGGRG